MTRRCEAESAGKMMFADAREEFDEILLCDNKATDSIVVRHHEWKSANRNEKMIFRLCHTHFKKYQNMHEPAPLGCDCGDHVDVRFREGRL